jgi:hypothetical protein
VHDTGNADQRKTGRLKRVDGRRILAYLNLWTAVSGRFTGRIRSLILTIV